LCLRHLPAWPLNTAFCGDAPQGRGVHCVAFVRIHCDCVQRIGRSLRNEGKIRLRVAILRLRAAVPDQVESNAAQDGLAPLFTR
jgi:hypothetical protein